jgi:hypothetical protein
VQLVLPHLLTRIGLLVGSFALVSCDAHISVRGVIKDGSGSLLEGALVELKPARGGVVAKDKTSQDGSFRIGRTYGFRSGHLVLAVSKAGYKSLTIELSPAPRYGCDVTLSGESQPAASAGACRPAS